MVGATKLGRTSLLVPTMEPVGPLHKKGSNLLSKKGACLPKIELKPVVGAPHLPSGIDLPRSHGAGKLGGMRTHCLALAPHFFFGGELA